MLHSSPRGAALKILSRLEGGAEAIILNDFHFLRAHMLPKQINKYLSLLAGERSTQDHPPTFTLQGSLLLWPDPMAKECRGNWIIRCWYFHSRPTLDLLTLFIYLRVMLFFSACCREAGTRLVVRPPHLHYLGYHFDSPFNHTRP